MINEQYLRRAQYRGLHVKHGYENHSAIKLMITAGLPCVKFLLSFIYVKNLKFVCEIAKREYYILRRKKIQYARSQHLLLSRSIVESICL